jgi:hypothetical protein
MCLPNRRYPLSDFMMGPLSGKQGSATVDRISEALLNFQKERVRQFEDDPPRGLLPPSGTVGGWQCPNCGSAHSPDIATCPVLVADSTY